MVHELKCWPGPFRAIWQGDKTFEIRKDDRGFAVGDELVLRFFDPDDGPLALTIRARVCYMVKGEWGLPDDICVMGIRVLSRHDEVV
jgi:hypothetical protein